MAKESQLTLLEREKTAAELQTLSRQSVQWLVQRIAEIKNIRAVPAQVRNERNRYTRRFLLGGLYFFYYNPKTKDNLPYYDTFPLVLMLERYSDGFLGLNLHYLPVKYRVALLRKLIGFGAIYNDQDELKRIRITYDILNATRRFREYKPCLKRYLNSNIRSRILAVQPNEWDIATYLPVQQFKKAKPNEVWQDSIQEIRNS